MDSLILYYLHFFGLLGPILFTFLQTFGFDTIYNVMDIRIRYFIYLTNSTRTGPVTRVKNLFMSVQ